MKRTYHCVITPHYVPAPDHTGVIRGAGYRAHLSLRMWIRTRRAQGYGLTVEEAIADAEAVARDVWGVEPVRGRVDDETE